MGAWLQPLCYFAAEATAERSWARAARALDACSACIQHGSNLQVAPAPGQAEADQPPSKSRGTACVGKF